VSEKKFIDVDKVLKEKAPGLRKWMPGFVVRWLKRKLHEDDINSAMVKLKDYTGLEFNQRALDFLGTHLETLHAENVPKTDRVIIAANHPLGGLDGMSLIKSVGQIRSDVRFFVNDVLLSLKNYGSVFVGINKVGSTSATSLRTMEEVLRMNDAVLFFPAGLVSRKINGKIVDLDWKKSFVTQAIDHKRLIVPAFIEGENSKFFYRFANFRKFIGIKANIEMLFLPDEMFKQKGHTVKIHYGKPFDPAKVLHLGLSHKKWAAVIKDYIYSEEFHKGIDFPGYLKLKGLEKKA
jgi:1-acyl-sn-glycerol-3-phosphate acyltransferase